MQTILGSNGTIGTLLAKELSTYTSHLRLVSRNPRKVNDTDEIFPADLSNPALVDEAIRGSEVVYLLVGFDYTLKAWQEKWPPLMRSVIDACIRYNCKLVFFDNVYLYDLSSIPHMTEGSTINAPSRKGKVREQIATMMMKELEDGRLQGLIARSADFYGPANDKSFLIETVYKNLLKGKNPQWFISIENKHSFTFTPDAAKATALLGNTPSAYNQVWHLPTDNNSITVKDIIGLFQEAMNIRKKTYVFPMWFLKLLGLFVPLLKEMPEMMYQYDRDYFFDSSKFNNSFNLKPTTYREGIKQIVQADR